MTKIRGRERKRQAEVKVEVKRKTEERRENSRVGFLDTPVNIPYSKPSPVYRPDQAALLQNDLQKPHRFRLHGNTLA
ncbi:MAG: hypothetical protein K8I29_16955 [Alphaproteobacteria bacterium]|uniref:Uncharacterized protein n=1 Tax=Candidatus Nitrobium versatile TaxID=2884831 RepID=A0A953SH97_9BACT|nr:hypothetical protein [Candidatus Nitrobium versatile]